MQVLQLDKLSLSFSDFPLIDNINLKVTSREKICLVGKNGAGKSTLLKIIEGKVQPEKGSVWFAPHVKVAKLSQDLPEKEDTTVFDFVASGLEKIGLLLQDYHHHLDLNKDGSKNNDKKWLEQLEKIQKQIEILDGWKFEQRINQVITSFNIGADIKIRALSGGWRRRVALARALVSKPDILLLDEPTNHLDIESILWMEKHLIQYDGAIICISHDRALVDKLATRIVELDRGKIHSYPGSFNKYLDLREKRLEDEDKKNALFDKKLAQEEVWIRQGIKARRTRNEGRVRALQELRKIRASRREQMKNPSFDINKSDLSGRIVIDAKNIDFAYNNKKIVNKFSTKILRGDKIGLIGPNGSGKTTLLKLLLGELKPNSGTVKIGSNIDIAYFDQLRNKLENNLNAIDNIAHGRTSITINGKEKHIISYLQDFLFTPEKARTAVKNLSGGEKNRLLLARLFSIPANFLVLDEPTNDLDFETLELLEELLTNFTGTVLLVSHDRQFIDNVTTQVIAFKEDGNLEEYIGSYTDWQGNIVSNASKISSKSNGTLNSVKLEKQNKKTDSDFEKNINSNEKKNKDKPKKLGYKDKLELEQIPNKISELEEKLNQLQSEMMQPEFYKQPQDYVKKKSEEAKNIENNLQRLYLRWQELD